MNKQILRLALPSIVSNIVVPLLGIMDLTIAGHLGATAFIGAVAVGAMMFNFTYWNFGFLRMGTSGMTAQAFGNGDMREAANVLLRSVLLAVAIGVVIVAFQYPLRWLLLWAISPEADVYGLASSYFAVCVWGAPALLATLGMSGWFVGMQNSVYPMAVSIAVNVVNIIVSLVCVFPFGMGFIGIAVGTLVAQWCGFILSAVLVLRVMRQSGIKSVRAGRKLLAGLGRFFRINSDIFLRSLCLMLVTLFFTSAGARSGNLTLAVNALVMQMFVLFSYFIDGFAFAGEALVGRYAGAGDAAKLRECVIRLFAWGCVVMAAFSVAYGACGDLVMRLLTDDAAVVAEAARYRWWAVAIPVAGMAAFVWDGIYIGLTATRRMLASLAVASAVFFATYYGLALFDTCLAPNTRLWTAFILYLATRGIVQTALYRKIRLS